MANGEPNEYGLALEKLTRRHVLWHGTEPESRLDSGLGSRLHTVHLDIFGAFMDGVQSICATGGLGRMYGAYGAVSAFHHSRLDFSKTGFTQQFRRRLNLQPIPCFLAPRGEGRQIGAKFDALTAPWP